MTQIKICSRLCEKIGKFKLQFIQFFMCISKIRDMDKLYINYLYQVNIMMYYLFEALNSFKILYFSQDNLHSLFCVFFVVFNTNEHFENYFARINAKKMKSKKIAETSKLLKSVWGDVMNIEAIIDNVLRNGFV
ncbi:hypothetical protein RFI_15443 [Reticulomyxa filosa]|uniref:Uncharacterized protein n=1 Tax=Reticulomyxa filosa TaxID=46433 RepID=X6N641_RETFI|nr:hypothetical protein RFI_15443 [Reticulomyxa filosa]|eukprot:ETO21760.1 hypothetical protein RFI_15443 [Reticulomyxa filosa]